MKYQIILKFKRKEEPITITLNMNNSSYNKLKHFRNRMIEENKVDYALYNII
jgi:hypothetical protein